VKLAPQVCQEEMEELVCQESLDLEGLPEGEDREVKVEAKDHQVLMALLEKKVQEESVVTRVRLAALEIEEFLGLAV